MNISYRHIASFILILGLLSGCASKKKRGGGEPSVLSKFYHNTTAYYNGYFNANELLEESYLALEEAHQDDYTEILSVYSYDNPPDAKLVNPDMDKAIEKVVKVAHLHENSKWIDDCYVLMGEAQYLKQDYETAEETLLYFQEDFDPNNPDGRNYRNKELSKKDKKKAKEKERAEERKVKEEERKAKEKEKEERDRLRKQEKKDKEAKREAERKAKKKAREEEQKRRKKEQAQRKKDKKRKKRGGKKKRAVKKRPAKNDEAKKVDEQKVEEPAKKTETIVSEPKVETVDVKEERKEEDVVEDIKDDNKSKKKDKTVNKETLQTYHRGQLLLAKTYVKRQNYNAASFLLDNIEREGITDKSVMSEMPVVRADINIQQRRYKDAIPYLIEAIEAADKKALKARYAFIQGQIYSLDSDYANASSAFANAKKWSKDFNMEFAAELNDDMNGMLSGAKTQDAVDRKLDKMLKQDKYIEQRDQIYFVQGEILYEQQKYDEAIEKYTQSIKNNVSNNPLKIQAYYKLATLNFDNEDYVAAKDYYDSTKLVLDAKHRYFKEVDDRIENLTEIAKNLMIIEESDSLLRMARLSDIELREVAKKELENQKLSQSTKKSEQKENIKKDGIFTSTKSTFGNSDFPFYNANRRENAKLDFEKKWGERPLVDNWRRKSAIDGGSSVDTDEEIAEVDTAESDEAIDEALRKLKASLPIGPGKKREVNAKIESAYYVLGKLFRNNISNYKKSNNALENLVNNYPNTIHKLDAYYYLYLNYKDLGKSSIAAKYKNKILEDFPESNFAKVINDPSYANQIRSSEQQYEEFYESTYALFQNGSYQEVISRAETAEQQFGMDNPLSVKLELLKTMALGSVKGKDVYINGLRNFINKYPNTPEQTKANELLRLLNGEDLLQDVKAAHDRYQVEDDRVHYFIVMLRGADGVKTREVKIDISNYNKKYHKSDRLTVGNITVDSKSKLDMILVRKFKNKDAAMKYYKSVGQSKDEFFDDQGLDFDYYVVSSTNYRIILQDKTDENYKTFFTTEYLNK